MSDLYNIDYLRSALNYDPESGILTWKLDPGGRVKSGDVAGSPDKKGYLRVKHKGRMYQAHRLAWLLIHGVLIDGPVDHINGRVRDNRAVNLREGTNGINAQNLKVARKDNGSGYLGVSPDGNRWRAQIQYKGTIYYLGAYADPVTAHQAYLTAKRLHHPGCTI